MFRIAPCIEADLIWSLLYFVWKWLVTSYLHHIIPAHCVTSSCGENSHDAPPLPQFSAWNWDARCSCSCSTNTKLRCYATLRCTILHYLPFTGPCIVIYSYSTTNKMHIFLKLFVLVKRSTCFGRSFRPWSGLKTAHTATGIRQTAMAICC